MSALSRVASRIPISGLALVFALAAFSPNPSAAVQDNTCLLACSKIFAKHILTVYGCAGKGHANGGVMFRRASRERLLFGAQL